jgi:hypothetical protein
MGEPAGAGLQGGPLLQPFGGLLPRWPERPRISLREAVFWLFVRRFGPPSAWVRARPRGAG